MATNIKELLQRTTIRTMRKDIKKLKEAVYFRKREKPAEIKTAIKEKIASQPITKTQLPVGNKTYPAAPEQKKALEIKEAAQKPKVEISAPPPKTKYQEAPKAAEEKTSFEAVDTTKKDKITNEQVSSGVTKENKVPETPPMENKPYPRAEEARPETFTQNNAPAKEKEYLKKIPLTQQEKLKSSAKTEGEQRRKFMEDVEKWASSTNDNK